MLKEIDKILSREQARGLAVLLYWHFTKKEEENKKEKRDKKE